MLRDENSWILGIFSCAKCKYRWVCLCSIDLQTPRYFCLQELHVTPSQIRPILLSTGICGWLLVWGSPSPPCWFAGRSVLSGSDAGGAQDATQRRCWILVSVRTGGILRMILWAAGPHTSPAAAQSRDIKTCRDRTDGALQHRLTIN